MFKVKLETPRKLQGRPDAIARWERSVPVAMAAALAEEIKRRVQGRGEIVRVYMPASRPGRLVSPRYPGASAGTLTRSGARRFASDDAFRTAIGSRPNHFSPSGGMWDGSSVVSRGMRAAENIFRGRSEGQDPGFFRYKSGKTAARGRKVDNALKVWTVLEKAGVNVLEITDAEFAAVEAALVATLGRAVVSALGREVKLSGMSPKSHPVFQRLFGVLARG